MCELISSVALNSLSADSECPPLAEAINGKIKNDNENKN
jgi:hypothetical protein